MNQFGRLARVLSYRCSAKLAIPKAFRSEQRAFQHDVIGAGKLLVWSA